MSGIAGGTVLGAALAGPIGVIVGIVLGGIVGEALEWMFPSPRETSGAL